MIETTISFSDSGVNNIKRMAKKFNIKAKSEQELINKVIRKSLALSTAALHYATKDGKLNVADEEEYWYTINLKK